LTQTLVLVALPTLCVAVAPVAAQPSRAPAPEQTVFRRLNATEYRNAVRALLDLDVDVALPTDGDLHGFDTVASALSLSPALFDRYAAAARRLSRLAVGDPTIGPAFTSHTYELPALLNQDVRMGDDLPFGTRGGIAVRHTFPLDGEYVLTLRLKRNLNGYVRGLSVTNRLDLRLDGAPIAALTIPAESDGAAPRSFSGVIAGTPAWETRVVSADGGLERRFMAAAGVHTVTAAFVSTPLEPEGLPQPPLTGFALEIDETRISPSRFVGAALDSMTITGPFGPTSPGNTASRRRIFVCTTHDDRCAARILSTLARRAYRRTATNDELSTLMRFYRIGSAHGFDAGVQLALERVLLDPAFLFRTERARPATGSGTSVITDISLASRLSFFLWSGPPDDGLLEEADKGRLHEPATLRREVQRLLTDPQSQALVTSFARQWLWIGQADAATPDPSTFPEFDENLRAALVRETELFVGSIFREDRSVLELLTANYSFLNERLARHYGIAGVYGEHFRRVALPDGVRGGLLGQGAIHLATSYPTRTSPVVRGRWLLENMLGTPSPRPPPVIPALPESGPNSLTMRERMTRHRRDPACATCHAQMDPLGLAMEGFDAIGRWRSVDEHGHTVDASTTLADGRRIDGIRGVRALLLSDREQFVRTLVEKLMTYALGRGVDGRDAAAIQAIIHSAEPSEYRWSSLILAIVQSPAFRAGAAA
jgi:hypothetical protein